MTKVLEITKLIGEIETIVKRYYRMEFENESAEVPPKVER